MTNNSLRAKALAERKKGFKYMAIESIAIEDVLNTLDRLERLESERAMMVKILEFYAIGCTTIGESSGDRPMWITDGGQRARDILSRIKEQK